MSLNKINFKDGITYHDYHFNTLQYNVAAEIKRNNIYNFYDSYLEYSDYVYSYIDPILIENVADIRGPLVYSKGELSSIVYDEHSLSLKIVSGSTSGYFISDNLVIPETASEVILFAEEVKEADSEISYEISFDNKATWGAIEKNTAVAAADVSNIALKINFSKTGANSPEVLNYCLMWR